MSEDDVITDGQARGPEKVHAQPVCALSNPRRRSEEKEQYRLCGRSG